MEGTGSKEVSMMIAQDLAGDPSNFLMQALDKAWAGSGGQIDLVANGLDDVPAKLIRAAVQAVDVAQ